jgi:N-acetylglucosaminyl-diphospho-decaprenol L-rhamnosyltransferase
VEVRVALVVVNWNKREALADCLASIGRFLVDVPHQVFVVDNGSSDGSPAMVESRFPGAVLLSQPDNLGFAKANNRALCFIRERGFAFDYFVFLNNDAVLVDRSLASLIEFLQRNETVAAAVPAVYVDGSSFQTGVGGFDLTLGSAFLYFSFLTRLLPAACKGLFLHQPYFSKRKQPHRLDWLSGVCLVVRRGALEATSGFPEDYFMYAEDLALCRELRRQGDLIYYPRARVRHLQDSRANGRWNALWLESLFRYYRKNRSRLVATLGLSLLKGTFFLGFLVRAAGYQILEFTGRPDSRLKKDELWFYARSSLTGGATRA